MVSFGVLMCVLGVGGGSTVLASLKWQVMTRIHAKWSVRMMKLSIQVYATKQKSISETWTYLIF
uniref:Uncharacterized protein n=1 Tax=Arundo donax TaxID=35708 RepID=A0A0A9H248_ARUDO